MEIFWFSIKLISWLLVSAIHPESLNWEEKKIELKLKNPKSFMEQKGRGTGLQMKDLTN